MEQGIEKISRLGGAEQSVDHAHRVAGSDFDPVSDHADPLATLVDPDEPRPVRNRSPRACEPAGFGPIGGLDSA